MRGTHAAAGRHRPRKRFGQHFLAPGWAARVLAAIEPEPTDTFLEIGPGEGVLTRGLAGRAAAVTAVEIDRDLAARLRAEDVPGLRVLEGDILATDLTALDLPAGTRVAGNLPYNISTPILFHVLDSQGRAALFADATFMLQKEVADRLTAGPGSRDYGPLTIFTALGARVRRLLTLPPGAFRPAPKVTSAVVRLTFLPPGERPQVPAAFAPMVRALFSARRKTIANGLRGPAAAAGISPAAALARAGIHPGRRPEQLSIAELLALASALTAGDGACTPDLPSVL